MDSANSISSMFLQKNYNCDVMEVMILGVCVIVCAFVLCVQIDGPQIGCTHADPLSGDGGRHRE